jgi:hypothetical protein
MAFKIWRTGLHIQQDKVLSVALVKEKSGWGLRRWWQIPLAPGIIRDGQILQPQQLAAALGEWRKLLPQQHQVFLAFPTARTLQRTLSRPAMTLRENEQAAWIRSAISRELEMAPDALRFDYVEDTFSNAFQVTAAQNKEISTLLDLAATLRLRLAGRLFHRHSAVFAARVVFRTRYRRRLLFWRAFHPAAAIPDPGQNPEGERRVTADAETGEGASPVSPGDAGVLRHAGLGTVHRVEPTEIRAGDAVRRRFRPVD